MFIWTACVRVCVLTANPRPHVCQAKVLTPASHAWDSRGQDPLPPALGWSQKFVLVIQRLAISRTQKNCYPVWSMRLTNSTSVVSRRNVKEVGRRFCLSGTLQPAQPCQQPLGDAQMGRLASCSQGASEAATTWVEEEGKTS